MTVGREDRGGATTVLRGWRGLIHSRDGATAIEFALLAIPYFVIVFAILETFIAFTAEQLVSNAVDTVGRQLRTGQITYNLGRSTDKTQAQFRQLFCNEINILIQCSATEIATPDKLWLDVESYTSFGSMPTTVPMKNGDLDTSGLKYSPGGSGTINMLRAYYRWQIITDLVRPFVSTIRPSDGSIPSIFLIVATAAFQNEKYP
ncbi:TadE/TadG family type IV pilus assembly protein [Rhizobium sp. BK376]|uniref:TadE/TadG family type IV pilus assembly protein n=1 Tax=Rhizobium sp. BK376 TaxID=2512149 RepID=UPI0010454F3F|nr:TadE/TadG family type IV pilus assembly protein [Rhizobium sp. BK376]